MNVNKRVTSSYLSVALLLISTAAIVAVSPWSNLFPKLFSWVQVAIPLLLLIGCIGGVLQQKFMVSVGIAGCWLFIALIVATITPDEEYYFFHSQALPSKDFLIVRLIALTALALLLLGGFRVLQKSIADSNNNS
jgi:hypothetical protein